jgi:hypothetical protein
MYDTSCPSVVSYGENLPNSHTVILCIPAGLYAYVLAERLNFHGTTGERNDVSVSNR